MTYLMIENLSRYYYNEGLRQARKQQLGAAVQNLARAVSYDRDNILAWNLAGLCYYRLGSYQTARYCWTESAEQQPAENAALGYLLHLEQSLAETAPYFSQVASRGAQKRYKEAAAILRDQICSRFDASAALLNYLGVLQLLSGKPGKAAKCWSTVLSIDKSNPLARQYLEAAGKLLSFRLIRWKDGLLKLIRGKEKGLEVR